MRDYVSASELSCFLGCPRRHHLRYQQRLDPETRSPNLILGSAVHRAIQAIHEARMAGETEDLDAAWAKAWGAAMADPLLEADEVTVNELCELGRRLVGLYAAEVLDTPDDVEARMVVDLPDPRLGRPLPLPLLAYVDAVIADTVVEIKTAARKNPITTWGLQLALYSAAYRATRGRTPQVRVIQLIKGSRPRVAADEVSFSPEQEAWYLELAGEAVEAIRQGVSYPIPSWRCSGCEYKQRCGAA